MRLRYQFVIRQVAGQNVAVAVGNDHLKFSGMVKLNHTGAFLMELLKDRDLSREELVEAMVHRYDVKSDRAAENLDAFLDVLRKGGLLQE